MKNNISILITILLLVVLFDHTIFAESKPSIESAKLFFEHFVAMGDEFNSEVADFYSDDAKITSIRKYPFNESKRTEMTNTQYKELIRKIMPLAKARGDKNTFSDVSYEIERDFVRIKATRYSVLKDYYSPYSLLVGQNSEGNWLIYEENTETKPF